MSWGNQQTNTGQHKQYNQYNQQYQRPTPQQYQQYGSTQSLNNPQTQNRYNAYPTQQAYQQQSMRSLNPQQQQQSHAQYTNYSNQQRQAYNNQYNNQYANKLANAYQSSAPPVPSPFLQAQKQQNQNQNQQTQPPPPPGPPPPQNNNHNNNKTGSNFKLIADATPPTSDEETDNNNNNNNNKQHKQYYNNGMNGMNNSMHNMITAQQRMKQMISEQQKMIDQFRKNEENLRKQLNERDTHWRQTLQNSLNKKDLRINELFQETLELQETNKKEQMKVVELRQTIMKLRSESSKILFTQKALPGLPQKGNNNNNNNNMSSMSLSKSVSIPETEEIDKKQNCDVQINPNNISDDKKQSDTKEQNSKTKSENIVKENVPKNEKKNALEATFAAKKAPVKKTEEKKEDKSSENPKLKKYNKMKKIGMPMVSIINKMRMDGCDKELIDEFNGVKKKKKKKKKVDITNNPALTKYNKMKKIGMPMVSIINKMRMDGVSKELIAAFNGETNDSESEEEENENNIDVNDAKFDKYKKMKKLNMPTNSIINKMRMDGLSKDEIDAFTGNKKGKKKKKKDKNSAMQELAIAMGLKPKQAIAPQRVKKLKRIHWKVIELKDIKGTFWEDINKKFNDDNDMKLGAKFELDFQIRTRKPRLLAKKKSHFNLDLSGRGNNKKKRDKKDRITWIQGKRDQNIQIGLKTMGITNEEIYDSIIDMSDKIMNLTRLETIYDLVPTVDEQRKAEEKIDALGDDVEYCGPSEQFHIELSTIPEVKQQLTKWLFCKTFKELYMDRLSQVTNIIKSCYAIKNSKGLKCYLRIMLQIGNLMNHGIMEKSQVYGFDMESLNLLQGIKNFSGNKTLAMFLFEYGYNKYYVEISDFFSELSILKLAVRTETSAVETNIRAMADEFLNIDLFCRRLHDEYYDGDTIKFREYMMQFSELQTTNMMNLKVKIQNAQSIANNVASFYGIKLEEGKPENLFKKVQIFVDIMDKAKRTLIKLEKERQKIANKKAKEKEKQRKKLNKENNKGKKMKFSISQLLSRKKKQKETEIENEEKGNLLFHDIKMAASKFSQRQKKMEKRLSVNFNEKIALSKGQLSPTMVNDKIKQRLSSRFMGDPNDKLTQNEIQKIQNEETTYDADHENENDDLNDDEYNKRMGKVGLHQTQTSNNLTVPI